MSHDTLCHVIHGHSDNAISRICYNNSLSKSLATVYFFYLRLSSLCICDNRECFYCDINQKYISFLGRRRLASMEMNYNALLSSSFRKCWIFLITWKYFSEDPQIFAGRRVFIFVSVSGYSVLFTSVVYFLTFYQRLTVNSLLVNSLRITIF